MHEEEARKAGLDSDRKRAAVLCVVSFATVAALDWRAPPAIPFGLYFLVPVALAAWYLDAVTMSLLVIASSIVRTLALSRLFGEREPLLYAVDALNSLVLFSSAALLLSRMRNAQRQLAAQAAELRMHARRAEERLRLEWSIRRAVPTDVESIIALSVDGARSGDLDKAILETVHQQLLRSTFARSMEQGQTGRRTWHASQAVVPIEYWIAQIDDKVAGFFMVLGLDDKRGSERELHAIVTAEEFRGKGVGSAMLDFFCAHYVGRRMYAACKPGGRMHGMLLKRGFSQFVNSQEGLVIVERPEWKGAKRAPGSAPGPLAAAPDGQQ